jgi:hypothetical protein
LLVGAGVTLRRPQTSEQTAARFRALHARRQLRALESPARRMIAACERDERAIAEELRVLLHRGDVAPATLARLSQLRRDLEALRETLRERIEAARREAT